MRLSEIPGLLLDDALRKLRRLVIVGAVITVCALVIVIEGLAAVRLALEPLVGPVLARLVLVGFFVVVAAAAYFLLRDDSKPATTEERANDNRVAVIAEAISLGYSLARDFGKPQPAANGTPQPTVAEPPPERPAA
jgi:hypothetical protein